MLQLGDRLRGGVFHLIGYGNHAHKLTIHRHQDRCCPGCLGLMQFLHRRFIQCGSFGLQPAVAAHHDLVTFDDALHTATGIRIKVADLGQRANLRCGAGDGLGNWVL